MIELYGTASPNVFKVSIALEEMGLPYRLHFVDVFDEAQYDPAFLAISPTNRVPVIVDHDAQDGQPLAIFESGAILLYLAEKSGGLLSPLPRARSVEIQWLMYQMSTLGPMAGQSVHFTRFAPPGNEYGKERYDSQTSHVHAVLDQRLAASEYLGGDAFSIADIATYPWIWHATQFYPWAKEGGLTTLRPHLMRWFDTVARRPGVQRGMAALDEFISKAKPSREKMRSEAIERFLLRGRHAARTG